MAPVAIKEKIFNVGAVDWNIRDFHGYSTYKGSTYNAYLVMDDKIALFDTVKKPFKSDLLHHIRKITDPQNIDYLVVNHVEMDHSGCIPEIIEAIKPQKVFCSAMGRKALEAHFGPQAWPLEMVKNGQEISPRTAHGAFLGNTHAALARQHVQLPSSGQASHFQRCLWPALGHQ